MLINPSRACLPRPFNLAQTHDVNISFLEHLKGGAGIKYDLIHHPPDHRLFSAIAFVADKGDIPSRVPSFKRIGSGADGEGAVLMGIEISAVVENMPGHDRHAAAKNESQVVRP